MFKVSTRLGLYKANLVLDLNSFNKLKVGYF